jgi:hypothetical protein
MFKISITPTQQQRQSLRGRHGPRRRGGKRQVFNAVGRREPNACSCPTTRPTQAAAHAQRLISLVIYDPRTLAVPSGGWPRALAEIAATFVLHCLRRLGKREQRKVAFFGAAEIKPADWLLVWGKECVGLRGVQYGGDVHASVGDGCADRIEGD